MEGASSRNTLHRITGGGEPQLTTSMIKKIIKFFFNRWYKIRPPEMVEYWKWSDTARARIATAPDGSFQMEIKGEKYPLAGFPRGHVLTGSLARFKHKIKNLVFNDTWAMLEQNATAYGIAEHFRENVIPQLVEEIKKCKPDMLPPQRMAASVREVNRALETLEGKVAHPDNRFLIARMREGITFFLQEDDAYRFRLQWAAQYVWYWMLGRKLLRLIGIKTKPLPFQKLSKAFDLIKDAEVVPDMKARIELIQTVLKVMLQEPFFKTVIEATIDEIRWRKMFLTKADKYYFRGKYFKVDHHKYDY